MADSNLGCGPLTVKYLVFIFNFIFFLSGLILIIIGGIAQGFFSEYVVFFENKYETPAIGVIILGAIILVVSFFGCCGAKRENVCMLRTFSGLMALVLVCELAAGITIAVLRSDIEEVIEKNMKDTMQQYGDPKLVATQTWDSLQSEYDCCGTANYTDWVDVAYMNGTNVPDSCCINSYKGCGTDVLVKPDPERQVYTEGCLEALKVSAKKNMAAIIGGAVALALIQAVGIWMSCCLVKALKERYEIL